MADDSNPGPFDRLNGGGPQRQEGGDEGRASGPAGGSNGGSQSGVPKQLTPFAFKPGQSGNPGGTSRKQREFRDTAREYAPAMLLKLKTIALKGNGQAAVRAAEIIIERAWGKAPQPLTGSIGGPLDAAFRGAARAKLEAALEAAVIDVTAREVPPEGERSAT